MKIRKLNAAKALGSLTASVALLAGMHGAHAQGAPGAGSFPGSFLVPGTQTSFKVGGYVKFDYVYDFGQQQGINGGADPIGINVDSIRFTPNGFGAPITVNADNGHHIHGTSQMTASESRFNIETRTPTSFGELKTFIEGDFTNPNGLSNSNSLKVNSNSYGFRLRQAYGTFGPFLAGQTLSLFRDGSAEAETLDFGGPMALGVTRQPQVRYTFDFGNGLTWAASLENPQTQVFDTLAGASVSTFGQGQGDKVPDFVTAVQYNAPWGRLKLAGVARDIYWHNGVSTSIPGGRDANTFGWGVAFSGNWNVPLGKDGMGWEAGFGRGAGRYINSDGPPTPDAYMLHNSPTDQQNLHDIKSWIVNANYTHFWTDTLRSNIAGSYWRQENSSLINNTPITGAGGTFQDILWQSAYTAEANLIWSPVPQTNFGIEFTRMQGKKADGATGDLTRVQLSAQFKF